ncbi:L,D-transpeptidase family protein [Paenibacillus methanolicus]|uniref:Copper amine oxidase-like protein n=1 Tax=Paenibacillus methanolicus TaxID=582686 RepID=A0A5S5CI81_9BACL|nr:L,D-transpeptidase family protein [Paenibacillus methanolicus]TYP79460.1 copper amine oxidase-like protein [Paenibacillus methanolicus]
MHPFTRKWVMVMIAMLVCCAAMFPAAAQAGSAQEDLIIVNKKTNKLAYFSGGELVKEFRVATGKTPSLTPEGSFKIVNKIKNRPYYKEHIPGGDPANPLGDRWLGLDVNGTKGTTYAIHGNNNKKSIGKYVSAGCIRMYNDDIHWLFGEIKTGTVAFITSSKLSFEELAIKHGYALGVQRFDGTLVVNGAEVPLERQLLNANSRIYMPMRECFEILGATVVWDEATRTATATIAGRVITYVPGESKAYVDGEAVAIDPSRWENESIMLPLRGISGLLGYQVEWDSKSKAIILTS